MVTNDLRLPDIEVRVTAGAFDALVIGWYAGRNPNDSLEVIAVQTGASDIRALVEILQDALTIVRSQDWRPMVELNSGDCEDEKDPPF